MLIATGLKMGIKYFSYITCGDNVFPGVIISASYSSIAWVFILIKKWYLHSPIAGYAPVLAFYGESNAPPK